MHILATSRFKIETSSPLTLASLLPSADILLIPPTSICLTKTSTDLTFHLIGPTSENEIMLHTALTAFHDAVQLVLKGLVEKRTLLENLDLVLLALDETIDDGCVSYPIVDGARLTRRLVFRASASFSRLTRSPSLRVYHDQRPTRPERSLSTSKLSCRPVRRPPCSVQECLRLELTPSLGFSPSTQTPLSRSDWGSRSPSSR